MLSMGYFPPGQHVSLPALGSLPPPAAIGSVSLLSHPGSATTTVLRTPLANESLQAHTGLSPQIASTSGTNPAVSTLSWSTPQPGLIPLPAAFALSPASEPFPQKLVTKVLSGNFVEMRELLTDNISLLRQMEAVGGQQIPLLPGALRPRLREVTSLPSWLYCFLAYVAILTPDLHTRDMLAYARLIIREAQRHGGQSWLDYDKVFRQQAALDTSLPWNCLNPGIQAATLIGRRAGGGPFCTLCHEPDHTAAECALAYLQQPTAGHSTLPAASTSHPSMSRPPRSTTGSRPWSHNNICLSWNKGSCIYPTSFRFRHICSICSLRHMAKDCTKLCGNSDHRQAAQAHRPPPVSRK